MARSAYAQDDLDKPGGGYRGEQDRPAARALLFAGTIIGLIGVTNVIQGTAVLSGSSVYPQNAVFPLAGDRVWGWVVLVAGLVAIVASFAIFTKSAAARWIGISVAVLNAVTQLFVMPARPLWSVAAIAADVLVIKALVVHGDAAPLS
jgi:hypothetical protein